MPKGYTVDGVKQYAKEYYDDNGEYLGPLMTSSPPLFPQHEQAQQGPSLGRRLLAALGEGVQGFADGVSVPNVAAGGGTDLFRGLSYALSQQQGRRMAHEKAQLQHELNQANEAKSRATAAWYAARPELEGRKIENAASVAADKSNQGWRKIDISGRNSDTNAGYKSGMLGVARQNADANAGYKGTMADVAKTNAVTGANRLAVPFGMKTAGTYDDLKNGARLIPEEYAERSPVVNANVEAKQAGTELTSAKTAETKERTSLMPMLAQVRATMAHAAMLGAQSSAERAQIAKNVYGFEYKGEDESGRPVLFDESGNAVSPKALEAAGKGEKIPAAMQTKVAQANTIVASGEDLIQAVKQLSEEGKIGPGMGRLQNAKAAVGMLDPEVKSLVTNLKNLASLLPAVHGQRGVMAAKNFEETLGGIEQKPESVIAGIQEIQKMSRQIAKDNQKVYHVPGSRRMTSTPAKDPQTGTYTVTAPDGKSKAMQLTPAQVKWYESKGAKVSNAQ